LKELAKGLEIGIDQKHNFFLINGSKDTYLAKLLTTLKAYMVSILQKNDIKEAKERATQLILDGELIGDYIHIKVPPEMESTKEDQWKIYMTVEGYNDFFMNMMFP